MMPASRTLRLFRRRLRKDGTRGAVGVEFAFIAPVFFTLLLGIIEVGIIYYAQNTLVFATQTTARLVRTGSAQNTDYAAAGKCSGGAGGTGAGGKYKTSQEWFKDQVCCGIHSLMTDCSALHVSVQNYTSGFGSAFSTDIKPVADTYSPGNACDVVLVRATYNWTVVTPLLDYFLANLGNHQHLLSATTAFRNEPFVAGAVC